MAVCDSRQEAIVCLAAGKSQVPILEAAKSLGYVIVAVDKNPDSPGFRFADISICESTYDSKAIVKQLEALKEEYKWVGVLNRSSGPPVVTTAEICEYFDIPGVPVESAKALVNKDLLHDFCSDFDIPLPSYKVYSLENINLIEAVQFPIVVKPALSLVGKSGVTVVRSKNNLNAAIKCAADNTVNGNILLEEYLHGPDYSLISFVQDGKVFPVCFLEELNQVSDNGKVSPKGFKTHSLSDEGKLESMANEIAKELVNVFHIKRSAFMVSFRVNSYGDLGLIEVHLDLGGDLLIEEIFPRALSYDFLRLAITMLVGSCECPSNEAIKPTAIFYDNDEGLVSDRNYKVFTADTYENLEKIILEAGI